MNHQVLDSVIADQVKSFNANGYEPRTSTQMAQWATYPGIMKLITSARFIDTKIANLELDQLAYMSIQETTRVMVRKSSSIASSQAGPVAVSIVLASLRSLRNVKQDWALTLIDALKPLLEDALNKVDHIIVDDTAWTNRKRYSSQELLKDSVTFEA